VTELFGSLREICDKESIRVDFDMVLLEHLIPRVEPGIDIGAVIHSLHL
jgi:hypothetical protein